MVAPMNPADVEYYTHLEANWEDKSNLCCNIAYFPDQKFTMIGNWKRSLIKPTAVTFVSALSLFNLIFDLYEGTSNILTFTFLSNISILVYFCLLFSYWILIIRGPGYVPFNWEINPRKHFSWSKTMSSLAIYQEQVDYARLATRPPRSSFSVAARRYVLRADHFCLWTDSWIGFNNQRYFILFTFWTVIYCLCWIVFKYEWYTHLFRPFKWYHIISLVLIPAVLYIMFFALHHFRHSFCNAAHNITVIEKYKKRSTDDYDRGCFNNFSEICGPKKYVLFWPIPCCCLNPTVDGFYSSQLV